MRASRTTRVRPGTRKAVWRARLCSSSTETVASLRNVCRSAQYRIRVPVFFLVTLPVIRIPEPSTNGASGEPLPNVPGVAAAEAHGMRLAAAVDLDVEPRGQRVDHRGADAVQPAGRGVRAAAELAARVQAGHHDLDAADARSRLDVDRDAAPVVAHLDRAVSVQVDLDPGAVPAQRLVDRVVDDLPDAVHQAAGVGRADVHARPLADRLQTLQDQQVARGVRVRLELAVAAGVQGLGHHTEATGGGSSGLPATHRGPPAPVGNRMTSTVTRA